MIRFLTAASLVFAFTISHAAETKSPQPPRRPASTPSENVKYGGSSDFDACGGSGIVLATTTVMTFDSSGFMKFDKIDVNQMVSACDNSGEGPNGWTGIVYGKKGQDCGVGGTVKDRKFYKGPCKSGWIKSMFFELLAG